MNAHAETVIEQLHTVVGAAHIRAAPPTDTIDGVQPRYVIEPSCADEVAHVLRLANEAGLHIAPRGGGSKLGWGMPPRGVDLVLSTKRLSRVIEHAWGDMTATVEAGCSVAEFKHALNQHGQRLALDPLWREHATIGGILSTNDSGSLRQRFGSLRDLVIGMTIALPDGTLARSGGKVVKNVAGYDLPKLMTGAWGTLGVITEATFRLYPVPPDTRTISFVLPDAERVTQFVLEIRDSTLAPTGLQMQAGSSTDHTVSIRFEGISVAIDAQTTRLQSIAESNNAQIAEIDDVWNMRESLWTDNAVVCKLTFLPANLAAMLGLITRIAEPLHVEWTLVAQAVGVGMLRLDVPNTEVAITALSLLRAELQQLDGLLVILQAPTDLKTRLDVWGYTGDALPLMQRVKQQFDPNSILNSGRFLGL